MNTSNEDMIELYQHGSGEDGPSSSRLYDYARSRSLAQPRSMSFSRDESRSFVPLNEDDSSSVRLEQHATEIVRRMEEDETLMEDNPISEHLRMETLRDMPQCLTLKRSIKAKLSKSVSKKSKHRPLGFFKRIKYQFSMTFEKFQTAAKNLIYSFELWYSSLKAIEGHFGSGVATYFKFLRWIFVMNFLICIPTVLFIFVPQIIYGFLDQNVELQVVDENNNTAYANAIKDNANTRFSAVDIITGEGYFTHTLMYYGFYTNKSISTYSMPYAYFFTMLCTYVITFIILSISMAKSYRKSFIETSGGLKNVYAHKVFCGWDYSIATKEGAELKSAAIYNELKELLSDGDNKSRKMTFLSKFWTRSIQVAVHLFIIFLLAGTALLMWSLLKKHRGDSISNEDSNLGSASVITAIVVTVIMTIGPLFFTWIIRFEDYKNPRTSLYISLLRTFLLEIVVIGVLVTFWLDNKAIKEQCWETSLGQEVYRLILIDFIFSVLFTSLFDISRLLIYKYLWKRIGMSEFDIARHTLQIIYNQTLFWVGFYFSPLLALVVTLKFWFTWYVKRLSCLHCCKPSTRSWRAAQTQTIFLVMTFIALFLIVIFHGVIMTRKPTSNCGPFQGHDFVYKMILEGVLQLQQDHGAMKFLIYLTKPGVITGLLIVMSVRVYYLRAKSNAQRGMVELLREMLVIEAKDKEFLLTNISKITEGTWMYNLNRNTYGRSKMHSEASNTWTFRGDRKTIRREPEFVPRDPNSLRRNPDGFQRGPGSLRREPETMQREPQTSDEPAIIRRLPRYDFHDLSLLSDGPNDRYDIYNQNYLDDDNQLSRPRSQNRRM